MALCAGYICDTSLPESTMPAPVLLVVHYLAKQHEAYNSSSV